MRSPYGPRGYLYVPYGSRSSTQRAIRTLLAHDHLHHTLQDKATFTQLRHRGHWKGTAQPPNTFMQLRHVIQNQGSAFNSNTVPKGQLLQAVCLLIPRYLSPAVWKRFSLVALPPAHKLFLAVGLWQNSAWDSGCFSCHLSCCQRSV